MVSRPSQFNLGLSSAEAMAACGPAAAIAFAQAYGRNPTAGEAIQLARSVGWSTAGMKGPASEQALLNSMGISTKLTNGVDWNAVGQEANTGNPVIVSTPGHYYFIDGFNPANGTYHVGTSGTDLKHGAEWMNPNQMQGLMGQAQGALFADHPLQGPSIQTSPVAGAQTMPYTQQQGSYMDRWNAARNSPMPYQPTGQAPVYQNMPYNPQQSGGGGLPAEFANKPYAKEAYQAAINAGIDPNIFLRQINQESGFNPNAGSSAGAQGIAQIVPKYHPGVNTYDPIASLNYAANLDKQLLQQYGGDYTKALVAYNGGGGAVNAWNSGSPYGESQQYVNAILSGQSPATFNNQGGQQQNTSINQIAGMAGAPQQKAFRSIYSPSALTSAFGNSIYQNAPPPIAQPNPLSMFSSIFTRPG
jgi:soluble lytic murein transglycosylase-like protein